MDIEEARDILGKAGQSHVLAFWDRLDDAGRAHLLAQISEIDFAAVERLRGALLSALAETGGAGAPPAAGDMEPAPVAELSGPARAEAFARGEEELRAGRVGALLVAGGQGTRLGFDGPKGCFPIGPGSGESLFFFHARKVLAKKRRYGRPVPLYVMTSAANDAATRDFFRKRRFFGLDEEDVFFFRQAMWPALSPDGKMILENPDSVFLSPDGHGGVLSALERSGALADMEARGLSTVFHFQVDNPMPDVAAADAVGFHLLEGADATLEAFERTGPGEKMGMPVLRGGRTAIVEYTEFGEDRMHERAPDGSLRYRWGAPSPFLFSVPFLRREAEAGLPIHLAHKKVPFADASGETVKPDAPNAYKFEKFVFDALADARRVRCLARDRREEYSPVKNAEGDKSPRSVELDLSAKWERWLDQDPWWKDWIDHQNSFGFFVNDVEIDPMFADSAEEVRHVTLSGSAGFVLGEWQGGTLVLTERFRGGCV